MSEYDSIASAYLNEEQLKEASDSLYKTKFKSGLKVFSDHNGFIDGELHTFIGPKGAGKSTWSKTITCEMVYNEKAPLLYISEEKRDKYVQGINKSMRLLNKSEEEVKNYLENVIVMSELDEKIESPDRFFSMATDIIKTLDLDAFIFDNFTTSFMSELPIQTQSKILRRLKHMADDLKIPILVFFHTGKAKGPNILDGDNVRGSGTAVNLGSYNYIITQHIDGTYIRNFVFTEKARYHSQANKKMYEMKYDPRVGLFVKCEEFPMEKFQELKNPKKKRRAFD